MLKKWFSALDAQCNPLERFEKNQNTNSRILLQVILIQVTWSLSGQDIRILKTLQMFLIDSIKNNWLGL